LKFKKSEPFFLRQTTHQFSIIFWSHLEAQMKLNFYQNASSLIHAKSVDQFVQNRIVYIR